MTTITCHVCDHVNPDSQSICEVCGATLQKQPVQNEGGPTQSDLKQTMSAFATGGAVAADVVGRILWIAVGVMAVLSLVYFIYVRSTAAEISAIQICQLAAESLTMAVIPYVIARACDQVFRRGRWHRNDNS